MTERNGGPRWAWVARGRSATAAAASALVKADALRAELDWRAALLAEDKRQSITRAEVEALIRETWRDFERRDRRDFGR